ncbi:MAG: hypothetical protein AB1349_10185, partial [Elusimicrobiota bacterium]
QNSKSDFKGQTFNLSEFANIFYSGSDELSQKNSVYSRFSGRYKKDEKNTEEIGRIIKSVIFGLKNEN